MNTRIKLISKNRGNIIKSLNKFFPKTYKVLLKQKKIDNFLGFTKITRFKKLERQVSNIIKIRPKLIFYADGEPVDINAYTYKILDLINFNGQYIGQLDEYFENNITYSKLKKIKNINTEKNIIKKDGYYEVSGFLPHFKSINAFFTHGLIDKLKEDELTAVSLHEIGHNLEWDHYKKRMNNFILLYPNIMKMKKIFDICISVMLLVDFKLLGIYLAFSLFFERLYEQYMIYNDKILFDLSYTEELLADNFAVKCGYGESLIRAFDNMLSIRKNRGILVEAIDEKFKNLIEDGEEIIKNNKYLSSHPSFTIRKEKIKETLENNLEFEEGFIGDLIDEKKKKLVKMISTPLISLMRKNDELMEKMLILRYK